MATVRHCPSCKNPTLHDRYVRKVRSTPERVLFGIATLGISELLSAEPEKDKVMYKCQCCEHKTYMQ